MYNNNIVCIDKSIIKIINCIELKGVAKYTYINTKQNNVMLSWKLHT